MKTIIALGGSIEAMPILRKIKDMGHRLVVVDGNPDAPGFSLAERGAVASCYSPTETVNALKSLDEKIDGVLCAAIDAPHVAAAVAEAFGLPGLTVEQAALGADKVNQIEKLARAGIPVPDFTATYYGSITLPTGETVPLDINPDSVIGMGRAVIKPTDSRGARGVTVIEPKNWSDVFRACEHARRYSASGKLIAEKWLDGPQLSTESLVQDGKVLFTAVGLRNYARLAEFAPYCIEDGFDSPCGNTLFFDGEGTVKEIHNTPGITSWEDAASRLIEQSCAALNWYQTGGVIEDGFDSPAPIGLMDHDVFYWGAEKIIRESCSALNWYQTGGGVVKGDLVIHDGKLKVIELAPRLSGGLFCAAHYLAYGVHFISAAVRLALGERIEPPTPYARKFVSQRYVFPKSGDIGRRIISRPYTTPEYADFAHYSKPIGHVIAPVTSHADRLGQALCIGNSPREAQELAERAVREMYNAMVIE